jgi:hypothetical protein
VLGFSLKNITHVERLPLSKFWRSIIIIVGLRTSVWEWKLTQESSSFLLEVTAEDSNPLASGFPLQGTQDCEV